MEFGDGHGKGVSWHWPVLKTPSLADPELGSRILIIAAGLDNGRVTECFVELHFRASRRRRRRLLPLADV